MYAYFAAFGVPKSGSRMSNIDLSFEILYVIDMGVCKLLI